MNTQQQDDHIIMFTKPNTKITLVSTPLNIKYLQLTLNSKTTTTYKNISLAELPFSGIDHGLPPNSVNTDSLPSRLTASLFCASETLKPSFDNLINQITTTQKRVLACIISDIFLGWVNDIARRVGRYHFSFITGGGYGTAVYFSMYLYLPHRKNDDDSNHLIEEFHLPEFPDTCRLHISQLPKQISLSLKSDGMLCNTVEEIEVLGLEILRNYMDSKPVWTIGPLLPPFLLGNNGITTNKSNCIKWLNHRKPSSILYISFGSQNTIRASKMMELALDLENSRKYFMWVLRPPSEFDIKSEFRSEWLPEGFVERMKESQKGLLVEKWAPQLEILCHKSTGAFLSHRGWNSESLTERSYNSKMMEEEMGIYMELARVDGQVVSEDVKKIIEQVMDSKKIIAAMIEEDKSEGDHQKGSSVRSVDHFLQP
ncbi:hypothetical protein MKX01_028898 [Papaver californicum]|nr:hypothetical protein MKX01_028898 [Papaver californicum]